MDNQTNKSFDNLAKKIQSRVFDYRIQAVGPNDLNGRMYENVWAISIINKEFNTKYLTYELCRMNITNLDNSKLPLRKGDENIFKKEKE